MKDVKALQQMHRDGCINHRDFLKVMGALGFSALAANELLTASTALAATPTKGGTAIYASNLHGPDDQMDPVVFTSSIAIPAASAPTTSGPDLSCQKPPEFIPQFLALEPSISI